MIPHVKSYLTKHKLWPLVDVAVFIVITYVFHKLWWIYYPSIVSIPFFAGFASWLTDAVYAVSSWIDVHIFRMDVWLYEKNIIHFMKNNQSMQITELCSGFKQMYQVLVLFLLFPGPWKHKLWYIPLGIFSMFIVNIIRIVGLSFAMLYFTEHWDFIHLWVLRPFYYVVLFALWVIWVEKFGNTKKCAYREKKSC